MIFQLATLAGLCMPPRNEHPTTSYSSINMEAADFFGCEKVGDTIYQ